jgi:hypothetical protein
MCKNNISTVLVKLVCSLYISRSIKKLEKYSIYNTVLTSKTTKFNEGDQQNKHRSKYDITDELDMHMSGISKYAKLIWNQTRQKQPRWPTNEHISKYDIADELYMYMSGISTFAKALRTPLQIHFESDTTQ